MAAKSELLGGRSSCVCLCVILHLYRFQCTSPFFLPRRHYVSNVPLFAAASLVFRLLHTVHMSTLFGSFHLHLLFIFNFDRVPKIFHSTSHFRHIRHLGKAQIHAQDNRASI